VANVTSKAQTATTPWGDDSVERDLKGGVAATYYPGAFIAIESASGYAVKCDDTAGIVFDGLMKDSFRITTYTTDASGDKRVTVERPWRFQCPIAAAVVTDIGRAVYAAYDGTAAFTTSNSILLGWVDRVVSATEIVVRPAWAGQAVSVVGFTGETLTFTGATTVNQIRMPDNLADALSIQEGSNKYITFITTNSGERINLLKQSRVADSVKLGFGDADDLCFTWDGTDLLVSQAAADSVVKWGVSGAGINHVFYGDTATRDMTWDQSNDQLLFNDNAKLAIGTGAGAAGDICLSWDGTRFSFTQLTANSEMRYGVDGAGIDQMWYGDTASAYMNWDQSADALVFAGGAGITGLKTKQSTAVAITGATTLTLADSGGHFSVSQAAAYDVDLPSPTTGAGCTYFLYLTAAGANNVTVTVAGSAATFVGSITIDGATIVATGSTLTFASGASSLGDSIMVRSIATNLYHVTCFASAAGGITIA
jgi:hypothetical protein